MPYFVEGYEKFPLKILGKIVEAYKTRLKKLSDITEMTDFFFKDKLVYDKNLLRWQKMGDREVKESLEYSANILSATKKWDKKSLEELLVKAASSFAQGFGGQGKNSNRGNLLWPLRVVLSGKSASASPFEIAEILGKEKTLKRISEAKDMF